MDYLEGLLAIRAAFTFDEQIRYMGWGLLLMWMLSITYMTREFWFPSTFGKSPREEPKSPPRTRKKPFSPQCFSTPQTRPAGFWKNEVKSLTTRRQEVVRNREITLWTKFRQDFVILLNLTITQLSDSELRMFVDEVQRKCEYYLTKRERFSSKE